MAHIDEQAVLLGQLTDVEVVDRARMGDELAFVEVARRHGPAAWQLGLVTSGSTDGAISATGGGLSSALALTGGSGVPFRLVLLQIVRSLASQRRGDRADDLDDLAVELSGDEPPGVEVLAYAALPETPRVALWLAETEHLDEAEIEIVLALGAGEGARVLDAARAAFAVQADRTATITDGVRAEAMATFIVAIPAVVAAVAVRTWREWLDRSRATGPGWAPTVTSPTRRGHRSRTGILAGAVALLIAAGALATVTADGGNVVGRERVTEAESATPGPDKAGRPADREHPGRSEEGRTPGGAGPASEESASPGPAPPRTVVPRTDATVADGTGASVTGDQGGTSGAGSPDALNGLSASAPPESIWRTSTGSTTTPSTVASSPPTTARTPPTTRPPTTSDPSPSTTRPPSPPTTQPHPTTTTTEPIGGLVCKLLPICPSVR